MSLAELGEALQSLGAWDAMNLDGGGSSALWIRGTVVNYPSDATGERSVGTALFVLGPPRTRR
jgi:exopolysaccharide biosynthesis protein